MLAPPKLIGAAAIVCMAVVLRIAGVLWGVSPNIITSDGNSYFAWARNLVLEQSFDFAGDIQSLYPPDPPPQFPVSPINGKTSNIYPPGLGLLELPAFLVAHGIAKAFNLEANGIHGIYDWIVVTWLVAFCIGGYFSFWRCTELLGASKKISFWIVLSTYFASNLAHYIVKEPFLTHGVGFSLAAMLSYLFLSGEIGTRMRPTLLAGLGGGLLLITRNSNLALAPWFCGLALYSGLFRRVSWPIFLCFVTAALFPVAAQLLFFFFMKGEFGFNGYQSGPAFSAGVPGLVNVLFSSWRGLFVFHPLYLLLICANLIALLKKSDIRILCAGSLVSFFAAWIINGSWWCWWFGASFGNRAFVEFLLPLSLGACAAWSTKRLSTSRLFSATPAAILICIAANAVLWSGYLLKRYSHEAPLTMSDTYLWWQKK